MSEPIEKYFLENGVTVNDVRSINCERTRLNCFDVSFRLRDDSLKRLGPFSGETVKALLDYWLSESSS